MFHFVEVNLDKMVVHIVGNKLREEGMILSSHLQDLPEEQNREVLLQYFFSSFKERQFFNFGHDTDVNLNEMYHYVENIFTNPTNENFISYSKAISKHLYDVSHHPRIKKREVYIALFENCVLQGEKVRGLGIFLSENKDIYIKVHSDASGHVALGFDSGTNAGKLEKGCIIFDANKEDGYVVAMVDVTNKNQEAQYFKDKFLKVSRQDDEIRNSESIVRIVSNYVRSTLDEGQKDKVEVIQFQKRAQEFLTEKDKFNISEFLDEVVEPKYVNQFLEQKAKYEKETNTSLQDNFPLHEAFVRNEMKKLKLKIVLDRKIEIKILDGTSPVEDLLEKGFDETSNRKFYKVFYNKEY